MKRRSHQSSVDEREDSGDVVASEERSSGGSDGDTLNTMDDQEGDNIQSLSSNRENKRPRRIISRSHSKQSKGSSNKKPRTRNTLIKSSYNNMEKDEDDTDPEFQVLESVVKNADSTSRIRQTARKATGGTLRTITRSSTRSTAERKNKKKSTAGQTEQDRLQKYLVNPLNKSLLTSKTHLFHTTYYPQLNDKIVFFKEGYHKWINNINILRDSRVHMAPLIKHRPPDQLPSVVTCTVTDIQYETARIENESLPVTLRTLTLLITGNPQDILLTRRHQQFMGRSFCLTYFDYPSCLANYMILEHLFLEAVKYKKNHLKDLRDQDVNVSIDREWQNGTVVGISPDNMWETLTVEWTSDKLSSTSKINIWELREIEELSQVQSKIPHIRQELKESLSAVLSKPFPQGSQNSNHSLPYSLTLHKMQKRLEHDFYRTEMMLWDDLEYMIKNEGIGCSVEEIMLQAIQTINNGGYSEA